MQSGLCRFSVVPVLGCPGRPKCSSGGQPDDFWVLDDVSPPSEGVSGIAPVQGWSLCRW